MIDVTFHGCVDTRTMSLRKTSVLSDPWLLQHLISQGCKTLEDCERDEWPLDGETCGNIIRKGGREREQR